MQTKAVVSKGRAKNNKRAEADDAEAVAQANKRRRTGEKRVAVRDLLVEEDDDDEDNGKCLFGCVVSVYTRLHLDRT